MQGFKSILIALCVPIAFAYSGCSNSDPTGRGTGAQTGIEGQDPNEEVPTEEPGEEGEAPTDAGGAMDMGGAVDSGGGGGATDTGGGGGGATDTGGGGATDTGGGGGGGGGGPMTVDVAVDNFFFLPQTVTIKVGDTVHWDFEASGHTVTSGSSCTADGDFNSGFRSAGTSYSHTFTAAGTYDYHCIPHCASNGMMGTVIVTP